MDEELQNLQWRMLIMAFEPVSVEGNYSPPSPLDLPYPYTTSSVYPDRPIRPLPKRRLRSRLSPEVANSILFPQSPTSPTKSRTENSKTPGEYKADPGENDTIQPSMSDEKESYQFRGNQLSNGSDEVLEMEPRYPHWRQRNPSSSATQSRAGHGILRNEGTRHVKPSIPPSVVSSGDSVDGYDSFENTNNKKKRKIPISGSIGNHHSSLSADMAHMDISSTRDIDVTPIDADASVGSYYTSGSSTQAVGHNNGVATPGKARFGRSGPRRYSGRSPLAPSSNGFNTGQPGRIAQNIKDSLTQEDDAKLGFTSGQAPDRRSTSNIISSAAALPSTPIRGQESDRQFESQSSKKPNSAKTQFTFTCDSDSAKSMKWPATEFDSPSDGRDEMSYRVNGQTGARGSGAMAQGTQTSPKMTDRTNNAQQSATSPQAQQPRKPRRSLAKQLAMAARKRRIQQEYENYNNPPKGEKVWVCEFCEYESIFGHPPQALIRQYEIKDRRECRRLAEKRRLLEKAKMKSKKGKKGTKNSKNTQAQQQNLKQRSDSHGADPNGTQNQDNQDDEYILDEYEDERPPTPTVPAQTPSRIPQPVNNTSGHHHTLRPPATNGGAVAAGGPT